MPSDFRGWDFWVRRRQVGTHIVQQVARRCAEGRCQKRRRRRTAGRTFALLTTASSKAAGRKVYVNGELQPLTVDNAQLKNTIRTKRAVQDRPTQ